MPLLENRMSSDANYQRAMSHARVPAGIEFEEVCTPEYFGACKDKVKVGDQIEVHEDRQAYYALLLVMKVDQERELVYTAPLNYVRLKDSMVKKTLKADDFDFQDIDGVWRVVKNKKVLRGGFESKADAEQWAVGRVAA